MKYYGVTDDSNELLHYGRLGMKWGQHIFVGPKSLSYKNALGKLKSKVSSAKTAIKKSREQRAIQKQQKREAKFNNAVKKAQDRLAVTERLRGLDQLKGFEKQNDRAYRNETLIAKTEAKKARIAEKNERKYAKNERKMNKYMQEAREGRLRYGKLSDEQVDRITQRLAIERSARQLGNTEKPSFRRRMRDARREGIIKGTTEGIAAGMKEVAIAAVQNRLHNRRVLDKENRIDAKRSKEASRIKSQRTAHEIKQDLKQEAKEAEFRDGVNIFHRSKTAGGAVESIKKLDAAKSERNRLNAIETKRRNDIDERWQQYLDSGGSEHFIGSDGKASNLKKTSNMSDNKLRKLYSERQKRLAETGYSSEDIKSKQDEAKRKKDAENKRRDDIDERWNEYIAKGGKEAFIDASGRVHDYTDDGKKDRAKLYDEREKRLNSIKSNLEAGEEAANKKAYDKWARKENAERKRIAHDKAVETCEKRYYQKRKEWDSKSDAEKKVTPKPEYDDYVNETEIKKAYRKPSRVPDYETAKRNRSIGLPSPLQSQNNNQQKKKQNNGSS